MEETVGRDLVKGAPKFPANEEVPQKGKKKGGRGRKNPYLEGSYNMGRISTLPYKNKSDTRRGGVWGGRGKVRMTRRKKKRHLNQ